MLANSFTNFDGILLGPVVLSGFILQLILLTSLTDALAKWNEHFCERFSSISFLLGRLLFESMIRFTISLSVNDGSMAPNLARILSEVF